MKILTIYKYGLYEDFATYTYSVKSIWTEVNAHGWTTLFYRRPNGQVFNFFNPDGFDLEDA